MSTIRVNAIQNTSGVEVYTAKAWVNFNGTGTVAIRAAGNVSSITDNGTGDYTVNFTTALADANYAWTAACGYGTTSVIDGLVCCLNGTVGTNQTTTALRVLVGDASAQTAYDAHFVGISVSR